MAENTHLKDLQDEIRGQAEEIKKLVELLEIGDQDQHAHTKQVQDDARVSYGSDSTVNACVTKGFFLISPYIVVLPQALLLVRFM